jgi:hypothetical protein
MEEDPNVCHSEAAVAAEESAVLVFCPRALFREEPAFSLKGRGFSRAAERMIQSCFSR